MTEFSRFDAATPLPDGVRELRPAALAGAQGGRHSRLIDVREPHEFDGELGHIAGAELVPLSTVTSACVKWNHADEFVLICRSGGRSGMAALELRALGFERVINLVGGMIAWNNAGLPVERT